VSTVLLGVPGVYDVQALYNALAATPLRFTADGQRICYTLPDGTDVLLSPAPGAVKIVRWLRCGVDYANSRAAYAPSDLAEEDEDDLSEEDETDEATG